eukprot:1058569-Prorocentrum_minimum.AAC.2
MQQTASPCGVLNRKGCESRGASESPPAAPARLSPPLPPTLATRGPFRAPRTPGTPPPPPRLRVTESVNVTESESATAAIGAAPKRRGAERTPARVSRSGERRRPRSFIVPTSSGG